MFFGSLVILAAIGLSVLAAYISVLGMTALFPAGGALIIALMGTLEASKIIVTAWLHKHFHDKNVSFLHRTYLISAVVVLMVLTSIGTFGFLSRSHLENENALAPVRLQIEQIEMRVAQVREEKQTLDNRKRQLDLSIETALRTAKNTNDAARIERMIGGQRKERDQLIAEMAKRDQAINELTTKLMPLRNQANDVEAKLGPIKYISEMVGISDPEFAVKVVIVLITLIFDPLAVLMFLAGIISLEAARSQRKKSSVNAASDEVAQAPLPVAAPAPVQPAPEPAPAPIIVEQPVVEQPAAAPVWTSYTAPNVSHAPTAVVGPIRYALQDNPNHLSRYTDAPARFTAYQTPVSYAFKIPSDPIVVNFNDEPANILARYKTDKDMLVEILERNPSLLESVIETVKDEVSADSPQPQEAPAESDPISQGGRAGWLGRPWIR